MHQTPEQLTVHPLTHIHIHEKPPAYMESAVFCANGKRVVCIVFVILGGPPVALSQRPRICNLARNCVTSLQQA